MRKSHDHVVRATPGAVVARRIAEVRGRRRYSQQELARRMTDLGYPINQTTIARIERGGTRAENMPLRELLVFGYALGVSPLHLFVPLSEDERLEITARISAEPSRARAWIRGTNEHLQGTNDGDPRIYFSEVPDVELLRATDAGVGTDSEQVTRKEKED